MLKDSTNKYNDTLLKVALERKELVNFITGIGLYEISAPQGMNVDMAFSYKEVMDTIYRNIHKYSGLSILTEDSFSYIFDNFKSDFIIRALNALNYHMLCEKNGTSTFKMDNAKLLQKVKNNIIVNKELFQKGEYPFWQEIEDVDKNMSNSHGIHIL